MKRTLLAFAVVLLLAIVVVPGLAAAENNTTTDTNASYYGGADTNVSWSDWMEGHESPSLANVSHYASRVSTFVVGTGHTQQGLGPVGVMLMGLVMFGALIGPSLTSRVGAVGGGTVAMVAGGGIAFVGMAPMWMYAVGLFALGLVALRAYVGVLR